MICPICSTIYQLKLLGRLYTGCTLNHPSHLHSYTLFKFILRGQLILFIFLDCCKCVYSLKEILNNNNIIINICRHIESTPYHTLLKFTSCCTNSRLIVSRFTFQGVYFSQLLNSPLQWARASTNALVRSAALCQNCDAVELAILSGPR